MYFKNPRPLSRPSVMELGDVVKVKVTKITDKGVNVSRKALLPKPVQPKEEKN